MADTEYSLDIELIKRKAISGVVTFTLRTAFIQAFTFFATFVLTILLDPQIFGIFFVVSALINLFIYFSDIGLAAALIQKKEEFQRKDLVTTFTIQQAIILILVGIGFGLSSKIASFYNLDIQGLLLLRVLLFSLVLSSLKTIPSIILERKLNFTRLVIPQIAENLVFYTTVIILAYFKFGIASFTWAVLARGLIGLILIYILSPWRPAIGLDRLSAKKLISFGIPFQLNSILALLKDDLLTVFIGKILPYSQVGYIGWAQKFAFLPLRFFMDNVIKVTFPAYSRLQDNKKELSNAVEKSLFFVTFFVYPCIFGIMAIGPQAISSIAGYSKWQPALPLLYFFAINALFASVNTTLTNTLFAIGKANIVLKLMVLWTVLTWTLTYILIFRLGYIGVGVSSALVAASTTVIIYFVKRTIPLNVIKNIIGPFGISTVMFFVVSLLTNHYGNSAFGLILSILTGILIYFGLSLLIYRERLINQGLVILRSIVLNRNE